jgi:hypothetical protein
MIDPANYWVEVKHRYRLPTPYAWEIFCSHRPLALMQSSASFKNELVARTNGEIALKRLLQKLGEESAEKIGLLTRQQYRRHLEP